MRPARASRVGRFLFRVRPFGIPLASALSPTSHLDSTRRRSFLTGLAFAASGNVLFSAKTVVIKLAYRHGVDPLTLLELRMLFAARFFAVALVSLRRGR